MSLSGESNASGPFGSQDVCVVMGRGRGEILVSLPIAMGTILLPTGVPCGQLSAGFPL